MKSHGQPEGSRPHKCNAKHNSAKDDVEKHNTSYGEITLITLDDYQEGEKDYSFRYQIIADNNETYKKGDEFQTTLDFVEYDFNGAKITTADKLLNTYMMTIYMARVIDGVSYMAGIFLKLASIDGNGTSEYEIDQDYYSEALVYIKSHPIKSVIRGARKFFILWSPYPHFSDILPFWTIILTSIIGLVATYKNRRTSILIIIFNCL